MRKHGQGTHSTKMGADKLSENTPNASKYFGPICLPKPKSLGFSKKTSLGVRSPCPKTQTNFPLKFMKIRDKICEDCNTKNTPNTSHLIRLINPNRTKHFGYH